MLNRLAMCPPLLKILQELTQLLCIIDAINHEGLLTDSIMEAPRCQTCCVSRVTNRSWQWVFCRASTVAPCACNVRRRREKIGFLMPVSNLTKTVDSRDSM